MDSYLTSIPAEIRLLIYSHLFTHPKDAPIEIRNAGENRLPPTPTRIRSRYHVLEKQAMLQRRCSYETTPRSPFHQQQRYLPSPTVAAKSTAAGKTGAQEKHSSSNDDEFYICAALMRVSRLVHEETSHLVYAQHSFDFGADMEAVEPFLSDLTPASRGMVRAISLYKRGPVAGYGFNSDRCEWQSVCRYLSKLLPTSSSSSSTSDSSDNDKPQKKQQLNQAQQPYQQHQGIRKLRLVVQCGKPPASYTSSAAGLAGPPREMSAEDFQLLADIKHESLDWVAELAKVGGIEELEIVPHVRGLSEFLRKQLRLVG
ncbi:hypothetical protein PG996_012510 [Apiospora saccharicola]|uniref:Uncharacterized protein n=1 Tax=Apiospora saccharicola TaxID=335842 RepID=A0ABR1U5K7_9PEZI